ncbi:mechanosensitive ion channel family protein [Zhihengliuella flava]|uniref:Small-conductance mechanosensitive channel n=1 Tax=Zhihengliuella flava TaxID=1285193 RepID=A0A931D5V8_9MICC|nr:mechanosensitive ion channel domain-containing protein [Zhihengliuella flava]MBG6084280.1 small-conductance mechanosensitive channel [Zhihengliuella flava]
MRSLVSSSSSSPSESADPLIDPDRVVPGENGLSGLTESATSGLPDYLQPVVGIAIAVVIAFIVTWVGITVLRRVLRKRPELLADMSRARWPIFFLLCATGSLGAIGVTAPDASWYEAANFLLLAGMVAAFAWLLVVVLHFVESLMLSKYRSEQSVDARRMSKMRTQVGLLRRVAVAVVLVLAVAGVLLMIPQVRALGAGLLASAGLISVVAGLAVQSALTNLFAGLQIAFTDSLRVDDTVFVEGSRGNVEEITLTYVVVKLIDETRLILPSTYFTTTPFRNYSRGTNDVAGGISIELTWKAPVDVLRSTFQKVLETNPHWDGRDSDLAVSDARGGLMTIFIWVTAANAGELWELHNSVREALLKELSENYPEALPKPMIQSASE